MLSNQNSLNGLWSGMPWWIKAVALVGFPTLFAGALLWTNSLLIDRVVGSHNNILVEHTKATEALSNAMAPHEMAANQQHVDMLVALGRITYILQITCQHNARTILERDQCVSPK